METYYTYIIEVTAPNGERFHAGPYGERESILVADHFREKQPTWGILTCMVESDPDALIEQVFEILFDDTVEAIQSLDGD